MFGWSIGKTTYGYTGGHDWVVDGRKVIRKHKIYSNGQTSVSLVSDLISCNWGWGGQYNGWFYHSNWYDEQNQYQYQTNYIYKKQMIHNVKPKNN